MRMTVLISDILLFYVPVIVLLLNFKLNQRITNIVLMLILCVPGFVLVDHGHFQYNCVMLGLVLAAYMSIIYGHDYIACVLFTAALSTKQMAMYYALAFFSMLLGKALFSSRMINPANYQFDFKRYNVIEFLTLVFSYAWIVVGVTAVIWLPWISW